MSLLNHTLPTPRHAPKTLSLQHHNLPSCQRQRKRKTSREATGVSYYYLYNPATVSKRTSLPISGTGKPCGALTEFEAEDTASFLAILDPIEANCKLKYLLGAASSEKDDLSSTALSRLRSFIEHRYCNSRIFRGRIASIELRANQPPRLHFIHGNLESVTVVCDQECDLTITPSALSTLCKRHNFQRFRDRAIARVPGTFHQIILTASLEREEESYEEDDTVMLCMGRRHADQECKSVAHDLCHRLWWENDVPTSADKEMPTTVLERESKKARRSCASAPPMRHSISVERSDRSMLVMGGPRTGKSTILKEILRTLAAPHGFFRTKAVIVGDGLFIDEYIESENGPIVAIQAKFTANGPTSDGNDNARLILEAVQLHGPDVVVIDDLWDLCGSNSAQLVTCILSKGVAIVCSMNVADLTTLRKEGFWGNNERKIFRDGHKEFMAEQDASAGSTANGERNAVVPSIVPNCFDLGLFLASSTSYPWNSPCGSDRPPSRYLVISKHRKETKKHLAKQNT